MKADSAAPAARADRGVHRGNNGQCDQHGRHERAQRALVERQLTYRYDNPSSQTNADTAALVPTSGA